MCLTAEESWCLSGSTQDHLHACYGVVLCDVSLVLSHSLSDTGSEICLLFVLQLLLLLLFYTHRWWLIKCTINMIIWFVSALVSSSDPHHHHHHHHPRSLNPNQITLDCLSVLISLYPTPSYHGNHSPDSWLGQQMGGGWWHNCSDQCMCFFFPWSASITFCQKMFKILIQVYFFVSDSSHEY